MTLPDTGKLGAVAGRPSSALSDFADTGGGFDDVSDGGLCAGSGVRRVGCAVEGRAGSVAAFVLHSVPLAKSGSVGFPPGGCLYGQIVQGASMNSHLNLVGFILFLRS